MMKRKTILFCADAGAHIGDGAQFDFSEGDFRDCDADPQPVHFVPGLFCSLHLLSFSRQLCLRGGFSCSLFLQLRFSDASILGMPFHIRFMQLSLLLLLVYSTFRL